MQDKGVKKLRRKYGKIKKNFVSVEEAEEEQKRNIQSVEEKLKRINEIKSLKVDTPWTTGSSDDGGNGYLYYKIQQAKANRGNSGKHNKILSFLDEMKIDQIDFSGMLKETGLKSNSNALFMKAQKLSENQNSGPKSSLFMRRKLKTLQG